MEQFFPRHASLDERRSLYREYVTRIEPDTERAFQLWQSMSGFFSSDIALQHDYDYFFELLYVDLTWRFLSYLHTDKVGSVVSKTFHIAPVLGVDVWQKIVSYLQNPMLSKLEQIRIYGAIRSAVLASSATFPAPYKNTIYSVRDIVEQIEDQENLESGSLEEADMLSRVTSLYMVDSSFSVEKSMYSDLTWGVKQLFEVIHFFLGVKPDSIDIVVREYFLEKPPMPPVPYEDLYDGYVPDQESVPDTNEVILEDGKEGKTVNELRTLSEIYQSAQSTFGTDLSTIDIPVLLSYLDTQATEQGDERIRDLVRFNESTGKFEWNTDMLSE